MPSLNSLLTILASSDVELIVVGMLAAVAQGAPVTTHDVDIVPRRTPDNIARLVHVLVNELEAHYRGHFGRVLRPTQEILMGPGHSLLQTKLGPLDVLGTIEGGRDYDALLPRSRKIELSGHTLQILDLEMLLELKRSSTRQKDQMVVPILEATLRHRAADHAKARARVDWRSHPLCAPAATMPSAFWGPERLDPAAWRDFAALLDHAAELAMLLDALGDASDVVDVGGGTGLLTQAIARRMPVIVVNPADEQRAHLPPGLTARAGRAEDLPLPDYACDAAIATWVLQYTDDPARAVGELGRVARRRVVIVQAAPDNDLVEIYNREAAVAGQRPAHHGFLLALAAERLEGAGFSVTLERVSFDVRTSDAPSIADLMSRLHFTSHPARASMVAATRGFIADRLAARGALSDDSVVLRAVR